MDAEQKKVVDRVMKEEAASRKRARVRMKEEASAPQKLSEWAFWQGARIYNQALIDRVSDSEFEERIGRRIEEVYLLGLRNGRAQAQTQSRELEFDLGA